jgi:tRNA threonylcarbamoyladenosine biosynthesis protein TsaE
MRQERVCTLEEFKEEARALARALTEHATFARVITLSGELGAGKTTFSQFFAQALGVLETLTSPTFIIYKEYSLSENSLFDTLIHADAYRLESAQELTTHGFLSLLHNPLNVAIIEWPEKVEGLLSNIPHLAVTLSVIDADHRRIQYDEVSH